MVPTLVLGQIARVRQRLYLVADRVMPTQPGDSTLVWRSCVDDDNQGQTLDVLWERELAPEVFTGEAWKAIATRGFDAPQRFAAYLHTLRWHCVTATDPACSVPGALACRDSPGCLSARTAPQGASAATGQPPHKLHRHFTTFAQIPRSHPC